MDKFISDSKAMYDQLYESYSQILNRRLDDVTALMREMISAVNSESSTIASTLYNNAQDVGYATSDAFDKTWKSAYESIKGDSDTRLTQMTEAVKSLIADGSISKENGQTVLDAIKNGDVTNIDSTLTAIDDLLAKGEITSETANKIRASMNVTTDFETAFENLQLVDKLKEGGLITNESAGNLIKALATGEDSIPTKTKAELSSLISEKKISIAEGSQLIGAITGKNAQDLKAALDTMDKLVESGAVTEQWKNSTIDALIQGDTQQLESSLEALKTANATTKEDAENIASLSGLLQNEITANSSTLSQDSKNISDALALIDKAYQEGKLTREEYNKLKSDIISADAERLADAKSQIQNLLDTGKIDAQTANQLTGAVDTCLRNVNTAQANVDSALGVTNKAVENTDKALEIMQKLVDSGIMSKEWLNRTIAAFATGDTNAIANLEKELTQAIKSGKINSEEIGDISALTSAFAQAKSAGTGNVTIQVVSTYDDKNFNNTTTSQAVDETFKKATEVQRGDFDQNGVVNASDASYLSRLIAQSKTDIIAQIPKETDFNGDGNLDVRDSAQLADWLAHKKNRLNLAKGAKRINSNTTAWTQEEGQEVIIRPSDGAILTPLARNDSVLNAQASSNIWNMATDPEKFIKENMGLGNIQIPVTSGGVSNSYTGDISVTLPNVQNYSEFKYAMQHDKQFEGFVRSITVDRLFGKSSLRKYKM